MWGLDHRFVSLFGDRWLFIVIRFVSISDLAKRLCGSLPLWIPGAWMTFPHCRLVGHPYYTRASNQVCCSDLRTDPTMYADDIQTCSNCPFIFFVSIIVSGNGNSLFFVLHNEPYVLKVGIESLGTERPSLYFLWNLVPWMALFILFSLFAMAMPAGIFSGGLPRRTLCFPSKVTILTLETCILSPSSFGIFSFRHKIFFVSGYLWM